VELNYFLGSSFHLRLNWLKRTASATYVLNVGVASQQYFAIGIAGKLSPFAVLSPPPRVHKFEDGKALMEGKKKVDVKLSSLRHTSLLDQMTSQKAYRLNMDKDMG
jgi:hypothetical protein